MKHKHYDVIIAFAEGKKIQIKCGLSGKWYDLDSLIAPSFSDFYEYRVKPETTIFRGKYRIFLQNNCGIAAVLTVNGDASAEYAQRSPTFIKWLTPWVEYEEEIEVQSKKF